MTHSTKVTSAGREARSLALQLALEGLTLSQVGQRLGLSRQRIYQLLQAPAHITQEVIARTRGLCEKCGILAKPFHIHAKDRRREVNEYRGEGALRLLCLSCARVEHQKRKRGR